MSLRDIVRALGGELYSGGSRASVPAPGHSPADRSVSLLVSDGRVIIHSFGEASWQAVRDDLLRRGLIDSHGAPVAGATFEPRSFAPPPPQAERVPVELGVRLPGWVEVVQGLAEGDTVVVSGQQRIQRDGVPLQVVEMSKPAPALTQQARAAIEIEAPKPGVNPCAQPLHTLAGRG